jgi:hypothetical protein
MVGIREIDSAGFFEQVKSRGYNNRLAELKRAKIIIPNKFFKEVPAVNEIYLESIKAYLFGLKSSALFQIVRCGEVALRERLRKDGINAIGVTTKTGVINKDLDRADFFEMIEFKPDLLYDKDLANYFRSLRNRIHKNDEVTYTDAIYAIEKITKEINNLFKFYEVKLTVNCGRCKSQNVYTIKPEEFFIGNEIKFICTSDKHKPSLFNTQRPTLTVILVGITKFSVRTQ